MARHHDESATPIRGFEKRRARGSLGAQFSVGQTTQIQKVIVLRDPQWGDLERGSRRPNKGAQGAQFRWLQP